MKNNPMVRKSLALAISTLLAGPVAAQQAAPEVDTSGWACEYCVYEEGYFGWYSLGLGYVADDAYEFGDFTGHDEGLWPIVSGQATRSGETDWWRFEVDELGLESRSLAIEGGQPGRYMIEVGYSELPHRINGSGMTPYAGVGSEIITLPASWVTAPNTFAMEALDETLHPLRLGSDRKTFNLGLVLSPGGHWEYDVSYERQMREGVRAMGGAFMFTSTILPAPIDYVTDQFEAGASYVFPDGQVRIGYYGSFFDNESDRLLFDNPFIPVARGADQGQFALEPDNQSHLVSVSGNYRFTDRLRFVGSLGAGRMEQDDRFLPFTVNENLPINIALRPQPLPRTSLDGEVDVLDVNAELDFDLTDRASLEAKYRYRERDNQSPTDPYSFITMDLFVNEARVNTPFSYERQSLALEGAYRFDWARLDGGVAYTEHDRTYRESIDTEEGDIWSRIRFDLGSWLDASVRVAYQERDGHAPEPLPTAESIENPLLRKFNYADRDRKQARFTLSALAREGVQITWTGSYSSDDYTNSLIGLTDSEYLDSTIDLALIPASDVVVHAFYTWESIDSEVTNSSTATAPNWFGDSEDRIRTVGVGIDFTNLLERGIDFSVDYVRSRSEGDYDIDDGAASTPFPDLLTRLNGIRLQATYPLKTGAELVFDYYRESWRTEDWTIDGVEPDTIRNLLSLGEDSPDYSVDRLGVWYRARF